MPSSEWKQDPAKRERNLLLRRRLEVLLNEIFSTKWLKWSDFPCVAHIRSKKILYDYFNPPSYHIVDLPSITMMEHIYSESVDAIYERERAYFLADWERRRAVARSAHARLPQLIVDCMDASAFAIAKMDRHGIRLAVVEQARKAELISQRLDARKTRDAATTAQAPALPKPGVVPRVAVPRLENRRERAKRLALEMAQKVLKPLDQAELKQLEFDWNSLFEGKEDGN